MERKKTNRADLEKGKPVSFMIGTIVALAILFTGFEWGRQDIKIETNYVTGTLDDDWDDIWITRPEPPEPPKPDPVKEPDILIEVPDDVKVEPLKISPSEGLPGDPAPEYIQSTIDRKEDIDEIFISVEIMPEFPGGDKALLKWIGEHMTYPAVAAENGVEGRVSCSFIINIDGSISDIQILRSIDPSLDREAIRVLKSMPNWKPGMQQGRPVRVKYNVPVRFKLQK